MEVVGEGIFRLPQALNFKPVNDIGDSWPD
jgi:hypothetical protein